MKSAKSANYWQIDNKVKDIFGPEGIIILSSSEAWKKFEWTRRYFRKEPREGYFIWVKKQIDRPLSTCISIANKNVKQKLNNLLIIEKGLNIKIAGTCNVLDESLCGVHKAQGNIILKEGSRLDYNHVHSWGKGDIIETNYEFLLEKHAKLNYTYKSLSTPKKLGINTVLTGLEESNAVINLFSDCLDAKISIKETMLLKEKDASGVVKLRLVGRRGSKVKAKSTIIAEAQAKGHLDCQGLLIDKDAEISLSPELICKDRNAQITHEASIGRISEEELNYLRTRGLSEEKAIDLIINGFLNI